MGSPKPGHMPPLAREDEVLERIRGMLGNGIERFGLRDDAAMLDVPGGGPLVVSVDSVVQGVHVDLAVCSPGDVGWKALMGALSDLAAMGAVPQGALVALCVPGGTGQGDLALGVMAGVAEAAVASGCPVVGGDVSEAGELVVVVTVLGTIEGGGEPVARSGARSGDVRLRHGALRRLGRRPAGVCVPSVSSGEVYRRPVARLREGQVARRHGAHAMIDVSDGLALDVHRLADASGVGFRAGRRAGGRRGDAPRSARGRRGLRAGDRRRGGGRSVPGGRLPRRRGCAARFGSARRSTIRPSGCSREGDSSGSAGSTGWGSCGGFRAPRARRARLVGFSWSGSAACVRRRGLVTLPARMHEVHTWTRLGAPSTRARTRCTLGFHRRLVRRCEWLTFMPNEGFLPQMSHTAAMGEPS